MTEQSRRKKPPCAAREQGGGGRRSETLLAETCPPLHSENFLPNGQNSGGDGAQLLLFEVPPPAPKDLGGRPRWNKADYYQELVEAMLDFGASLPQIAAAVGVSPPTLRRNFYRLPSWQARWGRKSPSLLRAAKDSSPIEDGSPNGKDAT